MTKTLNLDLIYTDDDSKIVKKFEIVGSTKMIDTRDFKNNDIEAGDFLLPLCIDMLNSCLKSLSKDTDKELIKNIFNDLLNNK